MKKLWSLLAVVALAYGAWRTWHGPAEVADGGRGQDIFYGRAWVDHLPSSRTDTFHVFGIFKKETFGWFAERSSWKGEWELFRYEPRGDGKVEMLLPHSGKVMRVSYRAWSCHEREFDYCLELSGAGGPTKYYSRRGWERRSLDEARTLEAQLGQNVADPVQR